MSVLSLDDCYWLLTTDTVGGITYTSGALPAVAPVTYVAAGSKVVIHVEPDKELLSSIDGHVVALQVDHVDKDTLDGWQVTVTGIAKLGLLDGQRRTLSLTSAITAGRRVKLA